MELTKNNYSKADVAVVPVESSLRLDDELKNVVDDTWRRLVDTAKANGQQVWDDPMQRFERVVEKGDGTVRFEMSPIHFSTRMGLRTALEEGRIAEKSYGSYVHCLAQTSDGWYVFGQKSGAYMSDRQYSFIGGVLDYDGIRPRTPFEVARLELQEEAGISPDNVKSMHLVGIYESDNASVGFTIAVQLRASKVEVEQLFASKTDKELSALVFVKPEDVPEYMKTTLQRGMTEIAVVTQYLKEG